MQFSSAIVVIALSAVASTGQFICLGMAGTSYFGGCCQTIDSHTQGQNCTIAALGMITAFTDKNGTTSSVQQYLCSVADKPEIACCHRSTLYLVHDHPPLICTNQTSVA